MGVLSTVSTSASRDQRRKVLMGSPVLKGLDFIVIRDLPKPRPGAEIWTLRLSFVPAVGADKPPIPPGIGPENIRILLEGAPDPYLRVEEVSLPGPGDDSNVLQVQVRKQSLQDSAGELDPPVHLLELVGLRDIDPIFSSAYVTFALGQTVAPRGSRAAIEPGSAEPYDVDYLAKDYESFRQLMLERMAFYVPDWKERNPSDLGVTMVEVLAYAADYLSYYQDAVATEAYLDTARRRISVRRHTRLLDFRMVEGTNARVWVHFRLERERADRLLRPLALPAGTRLLTRSRVPNVVEAGSREYVRALEDGALVFQTVLPERLYPEHDQFDIYTWGAEDYALEPGATSAALVGHWPRLEAGDVLLFEKRVGDDLREGEPLDPRARRAVRLSRAPVLSRDPLTGVDLTEIAWFEEDALETDYPVSRTAGRVLEEGMSTVWGNLVLADHGETVEDLLGPVPEIGPYQPILPRRGLSFRQPFGESVARDQPASAALEQVEWLALPQIELIELPAHLHAAAVTDADLLALAARPGLPRWSPHYDLLNSGRFARDFAVEIDDQGWAHLRFGDGRAGRRPAAGSRFVARYRLGQGPRGNVGSHAIHHVVLTPDLRQRLKESRTAVLLATNTLPGGGGSHPKPTESARVYAPDIIDSQVYQRRCVTESDHAMRAERHPEVARAVARQHWSGDSTTVALYVQRRSGLPINAVFERSLRRFLSPFLMAGCDLVLRDPRYVPLEIQLTATLAAGVRPEAVSSQVLANGQDLSPFSAADFTFGQNVYLSRLIARVMAVPGVLGVRADTFRRWGRPDTGERESGCIEIGPLEIARLDNDPAAPQRGVFRLRFVEGV